MRQNQKGFFEIIVILVIVVLVGVVGFFVYQSRIGFPNRGGNSDASLRYDYFADTSHLPSCGSRQSFFNTLPLALSDFTTVDPLGLLSPTSHVFPAPHLYFRIRAINPDDYNSLPAKVPLYSPGDVTVTSMTLTVAKNKPEFADDGAITFSPCREFKAYFDHVVDLSDKLQTAFNDGEKIRCDEYTLTYNDGPVDWQVCNKKVNVQLKQGELIGYAGGGRGQMALDLGAYDSRTKPNNFASPKRVFRTELPYNVCPFDYFTSPLTSQLKSRLGGYSNDGGVINSPTCGQVVQDIAGTAKGNWFPAKMFPGEPGHEPPYLALVQGHIDQNLQAFSNGESTKNSNLDFGIYYFEPRSSGFINRDFAQVTTDGNVYCYDTSSDYQSGIPKTILIQLIDNETLLIDGSSLGTCGSAPWVLSSRATKFMR